MGTKRTHLQPQTDLSKDDKPKFDKEALKREILIDLERQELKKTILNELKPPKSKIGSFAKHPAILLVLGFLLTTGLGTLLTSNWQSREWSRQQLQLAQQRKLDQKYALADDFNKAISETIASADDILNLFKSDWDNQTLAKEEPERMAYWRQTSRNWRVASKIFITKLAAYFDDPQAKELFQEIILKRRRIGNNINRLLADYRGKNRQNQQAQSIADETINLINETLNLTLQLTNSMVQEARHDESMHYK